MFFWTGFAFIASKIIIIWKSKKWTDSPWININVFSEYQLTPPLTSGMLASVRAGPARQSLSNPARIER